MNLIAVLLFLWTLQICANNQTEVPITFSAMHIQNTSSEESKHHERLFQKLEMDHHTGVRDYLDNYIDMSDKQLTALHDLYLKIGSLAIKRNLNWQLLKIYHDIGRKHFLN